jgi:hypothetical protein
MANQKKKASSAVKGATTPKASKVTKPAARSKKAATPPAPLSAPSNHIIIPPLAPATTRSGRNVKKPTRFIEEIEQIAEAPVVREPTPEPPPPPPATATFYQDEQVDEFHSIAVPDLRKQIPKQKCTLKLKLRKLVPPHIQAVIDVAEREKRRGERVIRVYSDVVSGREYGTRR